MVGTIESADAAGAVVATGTVRAKLPLASFGRNGQGLVIAMTRPSSKPRSRRSSADPDPRQLIARAIAREPRRLPPRRRGFLL